MENPKSTEEKTNKKFYKSIFGRSHNWADMLFPIYVYIFAPSSPPPLTIQIGFSRSGLRVVFQNLS